MADGIPTPYSRHRSSMSSAFRLDIVTDCPPYAAVNRRWPSFSSRRPSYLEQSTTARHVSTATGHLSQSPQDSSLQALLSITSPFSCRAREVTCHYGHVNRFYYLLTSAGTAVSPFHAKMVQQRPLLPRELLITYHGHCRVSCFWQLRYFA